MMLLVLFINPSLARSFMLTSKRIRASIRHVSTTTTTTTIAQRTLCNVSSDNNNNNCQISEPTNQIDNRFRQNALPSWQLYYHRQQQSRSYIHTTSSRNSSSKPTTSFFSSPLQWWRDKQELNELEKYKKRIELMAEKEVWTVGDATAEIAESVNSWKAKVPGASSMNEIKMAKEMLKSLTGLETVVGKDASDDVIHKMSHKDKLMVAVNGETSIEKVNTLLEQFKSMVVMHRLIRKRKLENKSLPSTPDALTALMKIEGPKLLSKEQKQKMGKEQAKRMMKRNSR